MSSVDHVNFAVNAESIGVVADYLRAQGLQVFNEPRSHTAPSVRVPDPDGNVIEIRLAGFDAAVLQRGSLRSASAG